MTSVLLVAVDHRILLLSVRLPGRRAASQLAFDLMVLFMLAGTTMAGSLGDNYSMVEERS